MRAGLKPDGARTFGRLAHPDLGESGSSQVQLLIAKTDVPIASFIAQAFGRPKSVPRIGARRAAARMLRYDTKPPTARGTAEAPAPSQEPEPSPTS